MKKKWLKSLDIPYVYQVNKVVASGKIKDLIRLSEINYDNKIHEVANKILEKNSKFVMIAGPSSSGKTTTCKKIISTSLLLFYFAVGKKRDSYRISSKSLAISSLSELYVSITVLTKK